MEREVVVPYEAATEKGKGVRWEGIGASWEAPKGEAEKKKKKEKRSVLGMWWHPTSSSHTGPLHKNNEGTYHLAQIKRKML